MTTTAHEDQFTVGTQTIEKTVRQPYDTVAILRRNIAALEVALKQQTERAEAAEAELAKLAQQSPIKYLYRVIDCFGHDVLRDDPKARRSSKLSRYSPPQSPRHTKVQPTAAIAA